jgi:hypothetical protein
VLFRKGSLRESKWLAQPAFADLADARDCFEDRLHSQVEYGVPLILEKDCRGEVWKS